jgi:uncharacterized membrane protein
MMTSLAAGRQSVTALTRDAPVATVSKGFALLTLILATSLAAGLRAWHLGANSLWADEFASLLTALYPVGQIPAAALRNDAFEPPVYFWLVHGIIRVAGQSEWALRLLSAIAGTLTIPIVWLLLRDLSRSVLIATTAALLLATNPLHIWYSQEARPYALLVCVGTLALLCLTRALARNTKSDWTGFVVLSALAVLVHVTGVVYPLIGCAWALRARGIRVLARLTVGMAGTFLLILPFLVTLYGATRNGGLGSPPRPLTGLELPYSILTFVAGYSFGPPVREIQDLGWRSAVAHHWAQTALVGVLLLWLTVLIVRDRRGPKLEMAILLLVPLIATLLGSAITTKAYNVRYTLPAVVGFLGLISLALGDLRSPTRWVGVGIVLGVFAWSDVQWFTSPGYWKEDSRAAARCLSHELPSGSTVLVAPAYMRGLLAYYTPEAARLRIIPLVETGQIQQSRPNALAITRSYHLPVAEEELVRAFQAHTGGSLRVAREVGYRLYFAPSSSTAGTDSACLSESGSR